MAAWHDLKERIGALEGSGLTVASTYRSYGVPKWLAPAWGPYDVFVLNVKGVTLDDTLCLVRLARLEQLLTQDGTALEKLIAKDAALIEEMLAKDAALLEQIMAQDAPILERLMAELRENDAG